jgi:hypothetical protein
MDYGWNKSANITLLLYFFQVFRVLDNEEFVDHDKLFILQVQIEHWITWLMRLVGLIYLHLQTVDEIFQRKIDFGIWSEALQFVDFSLFPQLQKNILKFLKFCCTVPNFFALSTYVAILPPDMKMIN